MGFELKASLLLGRYSDNLLESLHQPKTGLVLMNRNVFLTVLVNGKPSVKVISKVNILLAVLSHDRRQGVRHIKRVALS
jgi:hypothetical protein